jgi:urease accessory protein
MKQFLSLPLLLLSSPAIAHVAGGSAHYGFGAGFSHPFGGLDHCLAMIAVGLVSAFLGAKAKGFLPGAFLLAMLGGFLLGSTKVIALPGYEAMIIASVIGLGLALLIARPLPFQVAVTITAVFGLAHGFAHGVEGTLNIAYTLGFLAATATLHCIGLGLGFVMSKFNIVVLYRVLGGGIALAGLVLTNLGS